MNNQNRAARMLSTGRAHRTKQETHEAAAASRPKDEHLGTFTLLNEYSGGRTSSCCRMKPRGSIGTEH
jgi:hypothetical protein